MEAAIESWLIGHGLPAWLAPDSLVLVGLAGLVGGLLVLWQARRAREPLPRESRALAVAFVGAWLGAALLELVWLVPQIIEHRGLPPGPEVDRNFYGAVIGGSLAAAVYLRWEKASIAAFFDRSIWLWSSILVMSRLGCFLEGCCFGHVTSHAIGVRFPSGSTAQAAHAGQGWVPAHGPSLPVHPTQLYEATLGIVALCIAVIVRRTRPSHTGIAFVTWLVVYAVGRLFLDSLRASVASSPIAWLTKAQLISVVVLIGAAAFAVVQRPYGSRSANWT